MCVKQDGDLYCLMVYLIFLVGHTKVLMNLMDNVTLHGFLDTSDGESIFHSITKMRPVADGNLICHITELFLNIGMRFVYL